MSVVGVDRRTGAFELALGVDDKPSVGLHSGVLEADGKPIAAIVVTELKEVFEGDFGDEIGEEDTGREVVHIVFANIKALRVFKKHVDACLAMFEAYEAGGMDNVAKEADRLRKY